MEAEEEELRSRRQPLLADIMNNREVQEQPSASPAIISSMQQELISLLRKLVGETLACFMVVFTIMAVKINTYALESDGAASLLALSVAGGMATMVTIFTLGHVSGSHINPAVTVAYTLIKHFPLQLAPLYICAQLTGGIVASLVLEVVFKPQWPIVMVTRKGTALQAVAAESIAGFLLLFVCASVATDTRAIGQFAGLAISATVALDIIIVGPISGGGINPARALGPALVSWNFTDLWIYMVGPTVGGIFGALMYWLLRPEGVKKQGVHKEINIRAVAKGFSFRHSESRNRSSSTM
ncbi:hypothetical protein GOP47_0004053 [Adiantum capillus-veneris]|uniref:Uncharacterized protein n=1 Tax=Adiantum capillus-veneris TaxID=13818 RepID=A0A9D4V7G6_ADICA|nr:hypothetical protein GOP47_0004053 [Adiantum capillus-veneris]